MPIKQFQYKPEEGQNPYIGFMSFQHFRGEKMYSDVVVRPENNYTETENFECYPVPENVPQNGRREGYFPDTSIVYIRALWKEFEPEQGQYNYAFIEDIIQQAKVHGQSLIFRLMAHSTRASDDVPQWLKALIPCPLRPAGERVKDSPTDPLFLELFCKAITELGKRFDEDSTLEAIDISLPGAWGEGHNLHLYPKDTLEKIVDTYTGVFRHTHLIGQASLPNLLHYAAQKVPVGWRGDGLGEPRHTFELYPAKVEKIADLWKTGPVSFESYWWLGEWYRKGWDIDKIIDHTLSWHISSFNAKSAPIPYEWEDKIKYWISKMGYHFALEFCSYPENAVPGETVSLTLGINNTGVAPIYHQIPLYVRLAGEKGDYTFPTDVDIRQWMPGKRNCQISLTLPQDMPSGKYALSVGIFNRQVPVLYLCSDIPRQDAFYLMGEMTV